MTVKESISDLLNGVRQVYIDEQIAKGIRSSGKSADSLRIEIKETEGIVWGAKYFTQQKQGRRPGKFPPIDSILDWIRVKGIRPTDNNTTEKQLAFLFARKIANEGTDIFTGKRKGLEVDEKINTLVEEFKKSVAKQLVNKLKQKV